MTGTVIRTDGRGTSRLDRPGDADALAFEDEVHAEEHADTEVAWLVRRPWYLVAFLGCHIVLGVGIAKSPLVATAHAWVTSALLVMSLFGRNLRRAVTLTIYVGCADVLWRDGLARFPYEGCKYLLIVAAIVLLVRSKQALTDMGASFLLIALLLPAIPLTVMAEGWNGARTQIPFTLAGLVGLALLVAVGRRIRATPDEYTQMLLAAVAPSVALAGITSHATLTATKLDFTSNSNYLTSGGFGPNQVSAGLAIGAVCGVLCLFSPVLRRAQRLLIAVVSLWLIVEAILTFSRGGVYGFAIAFFAALVVGILSSENRRRALALVVLVSLAALIALPMLESFTNGQLLARYQTAEGLASRAQIASEEWDLFLEHPVFGVGPGVATASTNFDSHTEFSRLLAEHGSLGIAAIGVLVWIVGAAIWRATPGWNRLVACSLLAWSLVEMTHAATRVSVLPTAFFIASITLSDPKSSEGSDELRRARSAI
jgi:hypothetical protein